MALGRKHWGIIGMYCEICSGINLGFELLSFMEERERERERGERVRERGREIGREGGRERLREREGDRGRGGDAVLLWNCCHKLAINLIE